MQPHSVCPCGLLFCLKVHSYLNLKHTLKKKKKPNMTGVIIEFEHIPQEGPTGVLLPEQSAVCLP